MNAIIKILLVVVCFTLSISGLAGPYSRSEFDSRLVPPFGKIKFLIGQQSDQIHKYKQLIKQSKDAPYPSGYMLYEGLMGRNIWERVEFRDLVTDFTQSKKDFPIGSVNVGLFLMDYAYNYECGNSTVLKHVIAATGGYLEDPNEIDQEFANMLSRNLDIFIDQLKKHYTPVYLRIGFEFDNAGYCYDSENYKEAFRGIKRRIDERRAYNIATVWQAVSGLIDVSTASGDYIYSADNHYEKWYPGDEFVDWVGFSSFANGNATVHQMPPWCNDFAGGLLGPNTPPREVHDRILNFARTHNKPVMIGESAPYGYDTKLETASCIIFNYPFPVNGQTIWDTWYEEYFDYIEKNKDVIRIVSYINSPWQDQEYWKCEPDYYLGQEQCPYGYWGNSRVQDNELIFEKFNERLKDKIYLNPRWIYEAFDL